MNLFQRIAYRLRQAWAILRTADGGQARELPPPLVDPRLPEATLCADARRQGLADAERFLYDQWSFGVDGDEPSATLDPPFIQRLRHQREAAIREHRDRQMLTDERLAALRLRRDEAEAMRAAARQRMAAVAARESQTEHLSLQRFLAREQIDASRIPLPPPGSPVWEGESTPLAAGWRLLILAFLGGIVFAIQNHTYGFYLDGVDLGANAATGFTAATAALTVLGPYMAGLFFRGRHATGYDRLLAWLALGLLVPALVVLGGFGYLAARLVDRVGVVVGGAAETRSSMLGVSPATLVLVFAVVLLVACTMSFMLGLARRHPFQESYVRSREAWIGAVGLMQRLGARINPDYRTMSALDNPGEAAAVPPGEVDRELAITHAYFAAEEAYYEGLQEGFADPTFTEAIIRRRGRRAPEPPSRTPGDGQARP